MGRQPGSSRDTAGRLGTGLAEVASAAAAFRAGWKRAGAPKTAEQRMALDHQRAVELHRKDVRRFQRQLHRLRARSRNMTAVAAVGASAVAVDVVLFGPFEIAAGVIVGLPVAVVGGITAARAKRKAARLEPPAPPAIPPPPPRPLPPGVLGADESLRLQRVRVQLANLLPQITMIHAGAAAELRTVDLAAAPALGALVERLALLHGVDAELAGTPAQATARTSAAELRARLAEGVTKYEELLQAALQLLSAPDPYLATSMMLDSSVKELTAYAHGLQVAAPQTSPF